MDNQEFTPMEFDAIGEIMNISLGSSATAVSNMLDHKVEITTPIVSLVHADEFLLGELDPAIGVEIRYVSGLDGSNVMLLKRGDVKAIVDILLGTETPDEEFELNELSISAVCEVMNQMMGASATALSDFLGRMVNISTPQSFELEDLEEFKKDYFPTTEGQVVIIRFSINIENIVESEFINIMSIELARELVSGFALGEEEDSSSIIEGDEDISSSNAVLSEEEIAKITSAANAPPPASPAPPAGGGASMSQEDIERMLNSPIPEQDMLPGGFTDPLAPPGAYPPQGGYPPQQPYPPQGGYPPQQPYPQQPYPQQPYPQQPYPPMGYPSYPDPRLINAAPVQMQQLQNQATLDQEQKDNLDLILTVPLEVSVEIGRTKRKVQEILSLSKGSLVVLDKLAGEQVDLFVNGQCIAQGDVVVVDDNFGVRITQIIQKPTLGDITKT